MDHDLRYDPEETKHNLPAVDAGHHSYETDYTLVQVLILRLDDGK